MRNSDGMIARLGQNRYRISIEGNPKPDGSRNRIGHVVRGTREDAKKALAILKVQNNQKAVDISDITVADFFKAVYLPDMMKLGDSDRLAASTYRGYETDVRLHIAPSPFGDTPLNKLTVRGIKQWAQAVENPLLFHGWSQAPTPSQ